MIPPPAPFSRFGLAIAVLGVVLGLAVGDGVVDRVGVVPGASSGPGSVSDHSSLAGSHATLALRPLARVDLRDRDAETTRRLAPAIPLGVLSPFALVAALRANPATATGSQMLVKTTATRRRSCRAPPGAHQS